MHKLLLQCWVLTQNVHRTTRRMLAYQQSWVIRPTHMYCFNSTSKLFFFITAVLLAVKSFIRFFHVLHVVVSSAHNSSLQSHNWWHKSYKISKTQTYKLFKMIAINLIYFKVIWSNLKLSALDYTRSIGSQILNCNVPFHNLHCVNNVHHTCIA